MAARKGPSAIIEQAAAAVETTVADICGLCWPGGWPHGAHNASCEHGDFDRAPEQTVPVHTGPDAGTQQPPAPAPAAEGGQQTVQTPAAEGDGNKTPEEQQ